MIANAWTWEHHKLIIASMVQVKREASHASQACSGNGSWHHPPLTWMQQCSATMHPICWNHTTSNEHECISLQVVIRFLLGPSQVVAHLMLWIPSLLSLDFRHLFLGDDRVHGVHELLLYKRCWLYSGLYFGLIVRYNFCMWITHRCIYPIPFIYMYNRNHLLHMIGFPNNFPKWDQYVQNGILVEVAVSKTVSHGILAAILPFVVKPLWDIQPSSFAMWFAHTVNSGFGRTSQVKLQGSRRSRSRIQGRPFYIYGDCNAI